jgi:hypothetical protein
MSEEGGTQNEIQVHANYCAGMVSWRTFTPDRLCGIRSQFNRRFR